MLFAFERLFFEMRRLEGRCRNENGKANVVESLVEAVKQRSIKHIERKWKEQSVFIFSCLSIQLFIQPCFPFTRQTKKVKRERAHKTPIHKIKPIPNFILGKLFAWRVLGVLCGHEDRLFFIFLFFSVPFRALDVLQEAIPLPFHPLDIMCYSYWELLSQNIIIKQMDIYIIRW